MEDFDLTFSRISDLSPNELEICSAFSCNTDSLDSFLVNEAIDYDKAGLTLTTLVFINDNPVPAAYFSLSADSITLTPGEKSELTMSIGFDIEVRYLPAVKITKLAVHHEFQSEGIGGFLIEAIEGIVFNSGIAARFLVVDALNNQRAVTFYQKCGFVESMHAQGRSAHEGSPAETVKMFKDIFQD